MLEIEGNASDWYKLLYLNMTGMTYSFNVSYGLK